jgi:hypothetical protein
MLETNKRKLDWEHLKSTALLAISFTTILVIAFIYYYRFLEEKANEYQNSSKISLIGVFKSSAVSKGGNFCFFVVENDVVPIRCSGHIYLVGQKVKLTKVVNKSGNYYFTIEDFPPNQSFKRDWLKPGPLIQTLATYEKASFRSNGFVVLLTSC